MNDGRTNINNNKKKKMERRGSGRFGGLLQAMKRGGTRALAGEGARVGGVVWGVEGGGWDGDYGVFDGMGFREGGKLQERMGTRAKNRRRRKRRRRAVMR